MERKNWDLTKEKIKIQETERRTTKREVAKVTMELVGRGMREFINDKTLMSKVIFGLTSIYVMGYGFKSGMNLFMHYIITIGFTKDKLWNFLYNFFLTIHVKCIKLHHPVLSTSFV